MFGCKSLLGSPPPMRGKGAVPTGIIDDTGITPAHAGKRGLLALRMYRSGDHPRPCGEKGYPSSASMTTGGSPPPMRGKVHLSTFSSQLCGITPAHAGKRPLPPCAQVWRRDHPRPCGEKTGARWRGGWRAGSPPPMRGKERQPPDRRGGSRITPAHAGKSQRRDCADRRRRDHPRPCGEKGR